MYKETITIWLDLTRKRDKGELALKLRKELEARGYDIALSKHKAIIRADDKRTVYKVREACELQIGIARQHVTEDYKNKTLTILPFEKSTRYTMTPSEVKVKRMIKTGHYKRQIDGILVPDVKLLAAKIDSHIMETERLEHASASF